MTIDTAFTPLAGDCRCGQARFRIERAPIITHCCHCRLCQKTGGSAFRINAMIETDRLNILEGETRIFHGANSQKALQCPACGVSLWSHHPALGDAIAFVGVGLLDEGERLPPEAHYFTRSRHPWVTLPPDVPAFEELGDPAKPGARERIMAAMAGGGSAMAAWAGDAP